MNCYYQQSPSKWLWSSFMHFNLLSLPNSPPPSFTEVQGVLTWSAAPHVL